MTDEASLRPSQMGKEGRLPGVLPRPDAASLDPRVDSCRDSHGFIAAALRTDWSLFVGAHDSMEGVPLLHPAGSAVEVCPGGDSPLDALDAHVHHGPEAEGGPHNAGPHDFDEAHPGGGRGGGGGISSIVRLGCWAGYRDVH